MSAIMTAVMILFGGQDLEGWITMAGKWAVADGAMVCQVAPAAIRSSYESDRYILTFEYRCAGESRGRLYLHSKLDIPSGAVGLLLTRQGVVNAGSASAECRPQLRPGADGWIKVRIDLGEDNCRISASDNAGNKNPDFTLPISSGARGFLRF